MTTAHHGPPADGDPRSTAAGYELKDLSINPFRIGVVLTMLVLFASFVLMAALLFVAGGATGDTSNTIPPQEVLELQLPPEPRLEQNPNIDGPRIVEEADARLESYGWVDQRAGTAHIPIERAMELLLEQGISPSE